jgi:hypothetical protein
LALSDESKRRFLAPSELKLRPAELYPVPGCELAYSGFMGIIAMHVNRHQLRGESAKTTHFPNFCYGQTGFVAMMSASVDGTDLDFFSTMPAPARSRSEWDELAQDPDALREIIGARLGTGWPEHVMGVAQEWA